MTLHEIAKFVGGIVNGNWINLAGPGHSSTDRSLGICFDANAPDGYRVNSLAGDDEAVCRKYIKELFKRAVTGTVIASPTNAPSEDKAEAERRLAALNLWSQSIPLAGTSVEHYLAARRCIDDEGHDWNYALRFHPLCPFGTYRFPAMVALVRDVLTGEQKGIHRTALKYDGLGKRVMPTGMNAKMMMGTVSRGAILLGSIANHIGIAEGIETALSAQKMFGVPVWALMSASGISTFPIVPGVSELTIFADHDNAGLRAAEICARRYAAANIAGQIHHPPKPDQDWNDYLQAKDSNHGQ